MPFLDSNGLHYPPYDGAKLLKKADERDRTSPKLKEEKKQLKKRQKCPTILHISRKWICGFNIIHSYDCRKRKSGGLLRIIWETTSYFSKNKLNHNQRVLMAKSSSSFKYSCEAFLFPPHTKSKTAGPLCIPPHSSVQCNVNWSPLLWIGCW